MRLHAPRIAPLADAQLTPEQVEATSTLTRDGRPLLNIYRTLVKSPRALAGFLAWGSYILSKKNDLPARQREIVILRIGYLCRSGYEWTQHVRIGLGVGLTEAEVAAIKEGAGADLWSPADAALIRAADDLHHDQFVSSATWAELVKHFSEKQCMDTVMTAGQYTQVSMMLNSFGVQLDTGQTLDKDLEAYAK
jgi:alkylhydroperoxidase family enzyme